MWSHYAANHSGVCLGYDYLTLLSRVNEFNSNPKRSVFDQQRPRTAHLLEVEYLEEFPEQFDDEIHAIRTKTADWEYEGEWRLAVEGLCGKGGENTHGSSFGTQGCLREILFGINTDKPTRRCLTAIRDQVDKDIVMKCASPNVGKSGYSRK